MAQEDYSTMGEEYATVGEGYAAGYGDGTNAAGYETGAAPMMLRRVGPTPGRGVAPARAAAPFMLRPGALMPFRPGPAPSGGGMTEAQVRSIVASELARRVPYGDVPTRPAPDEAMFPMGLGSVTLVTAAPIGDLTAQPQRAFRGERLVLSVFRTAGAVGIPVVIRQFQIGDYKQLVGGGALPVEVFASDAFGVRLMLDASIPGVLYDIEVAALAPIPGGESIIIAGAVIGRAGEAAAR